jgi:spore coat assembly protein
MWKTGDLVARKSYGKDVCFVIVDVDKERQTAVLKGIDVRLLADAPFDDLEAVTEEQRRVYQAGFMRETNETLRLIRQRRSIETEKRTLRADMKFRQTHDFFERPGRVLHLDGDPMYLEKCKTFYKELGIPAEGRHVVESKMAEALPELLEKYHPDILILTGHDGLLRKGQDLTNVYNYRNSEHFINAVRAARKYERSLDDLVIFAGACQSHYEAILEAGANFASSPHRILIHALDPVLIAEKIAYTPINQTVNIFDVVKSTITGTDGLGGLESRGKYRIGLPRSPY